MSVSFTHVFRQGPTLKTLLRTAAHSVVNYGKKEAGTTPRTPGPIFTATVGPRSPKLVRDFIRHVGGNPAAYRGVLPPYMFPQWGMFMLARTLEGLDYDLTRILNGGCRLEIRAKIPSDRPLVLKSRLQEFDDNGRRAIFKQMLVTGTAEQPEALISHVAAILPLKSAEEGPRKKEHPLVPDDAYEVARWNLPPDAGLDFGLLTGDLNPVHWNALYARMSGFKSTIMHGFSATARMVESFNGNLWSGRTDLLKTLEVRFVRPFPYPSKVGLYVDWKGGAYVGDAPGGPAYVVGSYSVS